MTGVSFGKRMVSIELASLRELRHKPAGAVRITATEFAALDLLEPRRDCAEQALTRFGGGNTARCARKQSYAKLRFELADCLTECRLRDAEFGRSLGKAAFPGLQRQRLQDHPSCCHVAFIGSAYRSLPIIAASRGRRRPLDLEAATISVASIRVHCSKTT
jgi:hypothetical protein